MNKTQTCGYQANNQNPNARRKRNSGRPPGYWPLILAFLTAIEPVKQGFAGTPRPRSVNGSVRITLRLYSYAQVPSEILQRAEDDVVKVFRSAGVYVNFVDCPLTDELGPSYPACRTRCNVRATREILCRVCFLRASPTACSQCEGRPVSGSGSSTLPRIGSSARLGALGERPDARGVEPG